MPPLIDGHIHLDKTLLGLPWVPNQATGNRVADRIEAERKGARRQTLPEVETGSNLVRQVMASGTLHMRTHVDIDNQLGLRNLQEILKVRERFHDLVTIEIAAFPQKAACCVRLVRRSCSILQSVRAPTSWAGSTQWASMAILTAISMRSSASRRSTA